MLAQKVITRLCRNKINMWFVPCTMHTLRSNLQNKHTPTCPVTQAEKAKAQAEGSGKHSGGHSGDPGPGVNLVLKRAERSGKCRMVFIPESFFTFFHPFTGVTGSYLFIIGFANYCISKEIYVMEHEYYSGLSWLVVLFIVVNKFGGKVANVLDKQVDAVVQEFEKGRQDEIKWYEATIKDAELAQARARGQEMLIGAKRENVQMQLEAAYRERSMTVYREVKKKLDYQIKKYQAETRIQQKWMMTWILENVKKSITEDFKRQVLAQAIHDLEVVASK